MRNWNDDDWLETTELDVSELCAIAKSVIVAGRIKRGKGEKLTLALSSFFARLAETISPSMLTLTVEGRRSWSEGMRARVVYRDSNEV